MIFQMKTVDVMHTLGVGLNIHLVGVSKFLIVQKMAWMSPNFQSIYVVAGNLL